MRLTDTALIGAPPGEEKLLALGPELDPRDMLLKPPEYPEYRPFWMLPCFDLKLMVVAMCVEDTVDVGRRSMSLEIL